LECKTFLTSKKWRRTLQLWLPMLHDRSIRASFVM